MDVSERTNLRLRAAGPPALTAALREFHPKIHTVVVLLHVAWLFRLLLIVLCVVVILHPRNRCATMFCVESYFLSTRLL